MKGKLAMALSAAMLGTLVCAVPSQAQHGGFITGRGGSIGARPHGPFRGAPHGGYLTGPNFHRGYRGRGSYAVPYYPYYFPDVYPGYYSERAPSEAPSSRVVVVQNSQPQTEAPPPPPPESLVLELQGNHWVRLTSSGQAQTTSQPEKQAPAKASNLRTLSPQESAALETARELPPAVLVFRDGHKEQISRYTIVGGTIYTNKSYWNGGAWTIKVPIADLNVPATLQLNREQGTKFSLPSSPGEVVIRP